jgi:hypothetical protein
MEMVFLLFYFFGTFAIFNNDFGMPTISPNMGKIGENSRQLLRTYNFASNYGLFRSMTGIEGRHELILYGSDDHDIWKAYEFHHKPTRTGKMPTFIAPHQPRLDWQLWFSALTPAPHNSDMYLRIMLLKIFQNSRSVLDLIGMNISSLESFWTVLIYLAHNPFPDTPPQYLKISRGIYAFTDFGKNPYNKT